MEQLPETIVPFAGGALNRAHQRGHKNVNVTHMQPWVFFSTPPKTNMEPENGGPLEKEIPIGNPHFQVPFVNFWGCTLSF